MTYFPIIFARTGTKLTQEFHPAGCAAYVTSGPVNDLNQDIIHCQRCPRLRRHCEEIGRTKRKSYQGWEYWTRPVPNFGDPKAQLVIVGLAPAAHGANRTGRMFTGDRSGEWLYQALFQTGFASGPHSENVNDGLQLRNCLITAVAHCAPPDNKPSPEELRNCRPFLARTLDETRGRVYVALGQIAWKQLVHEFKQRAWLETSPSFSHGAIVALADQRWLLGSYHPSQQNTFTGRLTREMLRNVFLAARERL